MQSVIVHRAQPARCPFCDIAAGLEVARVLYQDDAAMAILDIAPVRRGHVLVIPREHVEDLTNPAAEPAIAGMAGSLHEAAKLLADRLGASGITCIQSNGASAGQEIAHLHVHLIPRFEGDGRLTNWERDPAQQSRLASVFEQLTGDSAVTR